MRYLKVWFKDDAYEAIPVDDDYELPELDEFDHSTMPLFMRIEAADGSVLAFPLQGVARMHLTEVE